MCQLFIPYNIYKNNLNIFTLNENNFVKGNLNGAIWENKLIGIVGPRGVGKTTLVLQYIKNNLDVRHTLYVSAEDFYFAKHRLSDLASDFVKWGGKYLFIDEIHKYPDWSNQLKLIYDYHNHLKVVFTGSSVLDLKKGSADLSRRAVLYNLQGLSFREYLMLFHQIEVPVFNLNEILNHQVKVPQMAHPLPLFADYLKRGYYPFALEPDFDLKLLQVVHQTLESDIPVYAGMNVSKGRQLKQLMAIIAESVPFKPNMTKISEILAISRNVIADYLLYMEEAGMLAQLRDDTKGIRGLGKINKVYLDNTNLVYILARENANKGNIRETFFINQCRMHYQIVSSNLADFKMEDKDFEIGGKNKGLKQIETAENGFLVKDDIESGFFNTIPLWHFGLMY